MADVNCSTLQTEIETQISAVTNSTCNKDVLLLADAHLRVSENHSNTIACTALLPNIDTCDIPPGFVVFNLDENCHVVSGNQGWYDMDANLIRQDIAINSTYAWGRSVTSICGGGDFNGLGLLNSIENKSSPVSVISDVEWTCVTSSFGNGFGFDVNNDLYTWGGWPGSLRFESTAVNDNNFLFPFCFWRNKTWSDVGVGWGMGAAITNGCVNLIHDYFSGAANCIVNNSSWITGSSPVETVCSTTVSDATKVAIYRNNILVLKQDKTIIGWGCNGYGVLGNNSTTPVTESYGCSVPDTVSGGFTDWCNVKFSSSSPVAAAIRENGTLWMWGCGFGGSLGNNAFYDQSSPVGVVGGFTDWCDVSIGTAHRIALRSNGTVWSWGFGSGGALGDNSIDDKSSPVSVVGGFTDWCAVSAGRQTSFGIRTNGRLYAWGSNSYGELGTNDTNCQSSPVEVAGGYTDWCYVSADDSSALAIRYILP